MNKPSIKDIDQVALDCARRISALPDRENPGQQKAAIQIEVEKAIAEYAHSLDHAIYMAAWRHVSAMKGLLSAYRVFGAENDPLSRQRLVDNEGHTAALERAMKLLEEHRNEMQRRMELER